MNACRRSSIFDLGSGGTGLLGKLYAAQGTNTPGAITPAKINAYGVLDLRLFREVGDLASKQEVGDWVAGES